MELLNKIECNINIVNGNIANAGRLGQRRPCENYGPFHHQFQAIFRYNQFLTVITKATALYFGVQTVDPTIHYSSVQFNV